MAWIKRTEGKVAGFASVSPPSAEAEKWEQANEDDLDVATFLAGTPSRNWGGFRVAMFQHNGFQQFCFHLRAIAPHIVEDLKIVAVSEPVWLPALTALWNAGHTLLSTEQSPSPESVAYWQEIAAVNRMEFSFDSDGRVLWVPPS